MTFAGIKHEQQRADVIAYLHTLSDSPVPLPKAAEARRAAEPGERRAPSGGAGRRAPPPAK